MRTTLLWYSRKSFVRGREDETSVERQTANGHRLATDRGWRIEVYTDAEGHRTGRYEHTRPDWLKLRRRLREGDVAAVGVDALARAFRSVPDYYRFADECRKLGVGFICIKEGIDTTRGISAVVNATIGIQVQIAQLESDLAAERMSENIAYLKAQGVYWGTSPYGSRRVGKGLDARMVATEIAGDVRLVLALYAAPGGSYASVAEELNRRGVRYRDREGLPAKWTVGRVRQFVGNVLFYAGYVMPRGGRAKRRHVDFSGSGAGTLLERYARAYDAKPTPAIEPIVDADLAERVIARRLTVRGGGRRPVRAWVPLLTPLIHHDGRQLRAQAQHHCCYYRTRGPQSRSWDAGAIEAELLDGLRGVRFPDAVLQEIRRRVAQRLGGEERAAATDTVRRMGERLEALREMRINRELGTDEYTELRHQAERAIFEARGKLNAPTAVDSVVSALVDLGAGLDRLTPTQRRIAIQALFERVDIDDEGHIGAGGLVPRGWAKEAFGALVWAWREMSRELLPTVTPRRLENTISTDRVMRWLAVA